MKKSPAKQRFLAAALAGASLLGAGANASAAGVSVTALSDVFGLFNAQPFDTTTNTLAFLPETAPGRYDMRLVDVSGQSCTLQGVEVGGTPLMNFDGEACVVAAADRAPPDVGVPYPN